MTISRVQERSIRPSETPVGLVRNRCNELYCTGGLWFRDGSVNFSHRGKVPRKRCQHRLRYVFGLRIKKCEFDLPGWSSVGERRIEVCHVQTFGKKHIALRRVADWLTGGRLLQLHRGWK